jgi:hypothetical protein
MRRQIPIAASRCEITNLALAAKTYSGKSGLLETEATQHAISEQGVFSSKG